MPSAARERHQARDLDVLLRAAERDRAAEDRERDRVRDQVREPGVQERREHDAEQPAEAARPNAPPVEAGAGEQVDDLLAPHQGQHDGDGDQPGREVGEPRLLRVGGRRRSRVRHRFMIARVRLPTWRDGRRARPRGRHDEPGQGHGECERRRRRVAGRGLRLHPPTGEPPGDQWRPDRPRHAARSGRARTREQVRHEDEGRRAVPDQEQGRSSSTRTG